MGYPTFPHGRQWVPQLTEYLLQFWRHLSCTIGSSVSDIELVTFKTTIHRGGRVAYNKTRLRTILHIHGRKGNTTRRDSDPDYISTAKRKYTIEKNRAHGIVQIHIKAAIQHRPKRDNIMTNDTSNPFPSNQTSNDNRKKHCRTQPNRCTEMMT